jgi:hypothetical protein
MKKRYLLLAVLAMLAVALSRPFAVPTCACGCTPGYWKNHTDVWVGYTTDQYFDVVFGVGPHMTLLEALSVRAKDLPSGSGVEAAYIRHATAALLNAASLPGSFWSEGAIKSLVLSMYGTEGTPDDWGHTNKGTKCWFENYNESGCPF